MSEEIDDKFNKSSSKEIEKCIENDEKDLYIQENSSKTVKENMEKVTKDLSVCDHVLSIPSTTNDDIIFLTPESKARYNGIILYSFKIHAILAAMVKVKNVPLNDPLYQYILPKEFKKIRDLNNDEDLVIVLMNNKSKVSVINKDDEDFNKISEINYFELKIECYEYSTEHLDNLQNEEIYKQNENQNKLCNVLEKNNFNYNDFKSFSKDELNNLENRFKECQKDKKFINYFGNNDFIRFTKESLDKYTEGNNNKFKFANITISMCLGMAKKKVHFSVRLSKDEEFMKSLNKWLHYIMMVSNPSEHQSSVLAGILLLYWYVIKQKHLFSNDIIESIKKCFSESVYNNNIKVAAALCLAYIIDHSDSFVTKIFDCLINYEQMKNFVNITEEDILLGLGKISLWCIPFKFEETLEKCLTKLFNFHWIPSNSFPQDIYDDLKIIYDNIGNMNDECLEVLIKSKFLDVSHKSLEMFSNLMKRSLENNLALDFIMLNLSIICDLCDQRINFAKNVCDKRSLMCMLNAALKDLSNKSSLSSFEKQFLENILFIYWNILKHGLKLHDKISTEMKTLFDNSNINTECKIASSLCLAMTNDEKIESMIKVKGYLENLLKENNEDEIYGFPKCEIFIAFGKVNICCTTTDKQSSNNLDSDICTHVQKYKSLLEKLVLNIDTINDKSVIDSAMELNMPKLMIEFIKKLKPALNLNENPNILNYFILEKDKSYLEILLSCCKFGVKNYEVLFELLSRKDNIVELALNKIMKSQLDQLDNRKLLTIAYNHVENENWNFFKIIVDKCEFPNEYLHGDNSTETFLTKMLADLPISSITEVWKHCKFNTNFCNKKHISPLMIASKSVEKLQWLVINKTDDFKEADLDKVKKAANELTSTNDRNQIMSLLNSIKTNESVC